MQNYKVEVKNHSEVTEVQELFFGMGYRKGVCVDSRYPKLIVTANDGDDWYSAGAMIGRNNKYKKITLQELRDMVAQKQKEYLVKTDTGYVMQLLSDVIDGHDGIIEVPEGSNVAWKDNSNGFVFFTKMEMGYRDATIIWNRESLNDQVASAEEYRKSFSGIPKATLDAMNNIQNAFDKAQCAINAQNAMAKLFTYPQYLSGVVHGKEFIVKPNQKKDESDLVNDGQKVVDSLVVGLAKQNSQESKVLAPSIYGKVRSNPDLYGFTQPEELPFVGDEPTGVDGTLAERQAQYGDFKDVAGMTQQLLTVMGQYGYEYLPDMHKEALHMICSKMARIVNGDHNHLDSWHDIGGYAKLIENNIK